MIQRGRAPSSSANKSTFYRRASVQLNVLSMEWRRLVNGGWGVFVHTHSHSIIVRATEVNVRRC